MNTSLISKLPEMKRKPRILLLICLTGLLTLGIPSCAEDYAVYRSIQSVEIMDALTGEIFATATTTYSDSIFLVIVTKIDYFSFQNIRFSGTMPEAWATSPEVPVMANEIRDIRIFCNNTIYGISPGQNLSPHLMFGYPWFEKWSLTMYLDQIPGKGDLSYGEGRLYVFFSMKPDPGDYIFTVEMEDNNGHIFTSASPTLEWL